MPTYDYRCRQCGGIFEVFHGMHETNPDCQNCGGELDRMPNAPSIHGMKARGREAAAKSLPQCGAGCRCCP